MGVSINIDLDTTAAQSKIGDLKAKLKALEEDLDLDIDSSTFDELGESLDNFAKQVEDLKVGMNDVNSDLQDTLGDIDETTIGVDTPDGETGGTGGENDPPDRDGRSTFDKEKLANTIEDTFKLDRGSIKRDMMDGFEGESFDEITRKFTNLVDESEKGITPSGGDRISDDFGGSIMGDFGFGTESLRNHLKRQRELGQEITADLSNNLDEVFDRDESLFDSDKMGLSERQFIEIGIDNEERVDILRNRLAETVDIDFEADDTVLDKKEKRIKSLKSELRQFEIDPEAVDFDDLNLDDKDEIADISQQELKDVGIEPDDIDLKNQSRKSMKKRGFDLDLWEKAGVMKPMAKSTDFSKMKGGSSLSRIGMLPSLFKSIDIGRSNKAIGSFTRKMGKLNKKIGSLRSVFKSITPSMRTFRKMFAILLPAIIAFATQAAGAGAAMLTLAGASAAIIGMGLAGEGEDIGSAFENAKEKISNFGAELFDILQPTFSQFTPITDELLESLPQEFSGDALEELLAYENDVGRMFEGIIGWFGDIAVWAGKSQQKVSQLAFRFGEIAGSSIIDFLDWLTQTAFENQEMLIELGKTFRIIGEIIYNLSETFGKIFNILQPLFKVLLFITNFMKTKFGATLTYIILTLAFMAVTIIKVTLTLAKLRLAFQLLGLSGSKYLGMLAAKGSAYLAGLNAKIWATIGSLSKLKLSLLALGGMGALILGAGIISKAANGGGPSRASASPRGGTGASPMTTGSGGGDVYYNDNREINVEHNGALETDSENRLESTLKGLDSSVPDGNDDTSHGV